MNVELTGVLGWIFVVSAVLFLLRLLFKVLRALREILYPYVLGRPKDLKRLAGSNWAGELDRFNRSRCFLRL